MLSHRTIAVVRRPLRPWPVATVSLLCLLAALLPCPSGRSQAAPLTVGMLARGSQQAGYPRANAPTLILQSSLVDPGSHQDIFGISVSVSADGLTALVGAAGAAGSVGAGYVYRRSNTSVPFPANPSDILPDPGTDSRDDFGYAVALSADGLTALIGAPHAADSAGVVYAYRRASLSRPFPITPTDVLPDPGPGYDAFGTAVALSGDGLTALIGGPGIGLGITSLVGAAYTFRRGGRTMPFSTRPTETLPDPGARRTDWFGFAVALSGDGSVALVGAPFTDKGSAEAVGVAYTFHRAGRNGGFTDSPIEIVADPSPGYHDFFGRGLAISADGLTILVAAPGTPKRGPLDTGPDYLYRRVSRGRHFPAVPAAALFDPAPGQDWFGTSVALSGDGLTTLVGASVTSRAGISNVGASYAYRSESRSTPFPTSPAVTLLDPGPNQDDFGISVALAGDGRTAVVGASGTPRGTVQPAGAAYTYGPGRAP